MCPFFIVFVRCVYQGGFKIVEILALFHKGGLVMYPILLASIIAVTIGVNRYLCYKAASSNIDLLKEQLPNLLRTRQLEEAKALCDEAGGVAGNIVKTAIVERTEDLKAADVIESIATHEVFQLKKYLNYLETIVTLSPLLGLLGTVVGMIGSFSVLSIESGEPFAITGGVGEALIATATGLLVAILALVIHTYLAQRVNVLIADIEYVASLYVINTNAGVRHEA